MKNIPDPPEENALGFACRTKKGIKEKADSNKNLSTFLFLVVLVSTVLSPLLILIGTGDILTKIVPSSLMAAAALASYWIQLRKPQERWVIYRTAQRQIEFEIDQFLHGNGQYEVSSNPERLLADRVSQRALQLHYEWIPVVPRSEHVMDLKKMEQNV